MFTEIWFKKMTFKNNEGLKNINCRLAALGALLNAAGYEFYFCPSIRDRMINISLSFSNKGKGKTKPTNKKNVPEKKMLSLCQEREK